jgi:hypothetical protein
VLLPRARKLALDIASFRPACVNDIRSIYDVVALRFGDAARLFETQRSRTWMAEQFDRDQLATDREGIVRRGRSQLS